MPHSNRVFQPTFRSRFRRLRQATIGKSIPVTNGALEKPFFIVGSGRSGTTLLRRILCSNPEVHIPPELFIRDLVGAYDKHRKLRWRDFTYLMLAYVSLRHEQHPYSMHALTNRLTESPKSEQSLATIISSIAAFDADQKDISFSRWGDKTPRNVTAMNEIMVMFPDARFVHSYRDGCDVVQSYVESGLQNYETAAQKWIESLECIDAFSDPDLVFQLRYEDFVASPEQIVPKVCDFLDIPFASDMLEVNAKSASALSEESNRVHHENLAAPVSTRSIGKGRAAIPMDEMEKLAPVLDPWLVKLGYARCLESG